MYHLIATIFKTGTIVTDTHLWRALCALVPYFASTFLQVRMESTWLPIHKK